MNQISDKLIKSFEMTTQMTTPDDNPADDNPVDHLRRQTQRTSQGDKPK